MRSLMVVVPNKLLDRSTASGKCKQRPDVEAFVIDGAKETLDFAVRLRRVRAEYMMPDIERRADLLEPRQPLRVERMAHRKGEGVIGQNGLDAVRECGDHVFEKGGRRGASLVRPDRHDGFSAEIVDGRELKVMPGVPQRRQVFEVEVEQLARPLFFIATRGRPCRSRQLIRPWRSRRRCTVLCPRPSACAMRTALTRWVRSRRTRRSMARAVRVGE